MSLSTPVVLLIFNRPNLTEIVFNAIRQAKPQQLLVIADGPRFLEEAEKCTRARAVIDHVDWECQVFKNYSDENLGCKERISSGLNWVFETVEEAIILEDDCLPCASFFTFCDTLIKKYRYDTRVMHISGSNFYITGSHQFDSYYFSRLTYCWGWATWRRAWCYYDVEMKLWPEVRNDPILMNVMTSEDELGLRRGIWDQVYSGEIDTWAYQWMFACVCQGGLTIIPNKNLISNLGCNPEATHYTDADIWIANMPSEEIAFPLRHPKLMVRDTRADRTYFEKIYGLKDSGNGGFLDNVKRKILQTIHVLSR